MRAFIALPPVLGIAIAVGCGRDPRAASPPPSEVPSSPATSTGTAPAAEPAGKGIDGGLPSPEAFALSTKASCPAKICRRDGSTLEALLGAAENRSPVGMWEEDLGADAAVTFGRRTDMDVLGLALAGNVALVADESNGDSAELAPWHAFVAPGSGVTLRAKGRPARLILMIVATGETPAARAAGIKASAWTARPAPIASTDLAAASDLTWGKGVYHARIAFAAETSSHASLGILKMSADGAVAPHVHENEWEHMAILRGEGDFIQGVGDGEQTLHASDGTLFSVPPGTRHRWKPAGSRPFLGIQVYTPPGPEQRFKKLAAPP